MQTTTSKLPPPLRRAALLLPLLCLSWLAQAQTTYFNSGSLSYRTDDANNRLQPQVRFKVREIITVLTEFRDPVVIGGVRPTSAMIDFGDGTPREQVNLTVLSKGQAANNNNNAYFIGEYNTTHTYSAPGRYFVTVRGENRLTSGGVVLATFAAVGAGTTNDSPVSPPDPIVLLDRRQGTPTYQVPASDPDGDALTYSLATAEETGTTSSRVNPAGLSINPSTGLLSFNTANTAADDYYTAVVKIADGSTLIVVDQLIRLVGAASANTAPVFTAPTPPNGQPIKVFVGTETKFAVRASDADPGDIVTLRATGLPPGAVLTPAAAGGNPAETVFSWTAAFPAQGLYTTTFTAQDRQGAQTSTSVTFEVFGTAPPVFVAPTPPNKQVYPVVPGQTLSFTVKVSDPDTYRENVLLSLITKLPLGATLAPASPASGNPAQLTFSWRPTAADAGSYDLVFQARDNTDYLVSTGVTVVVTPTCGPAANTPVAGADQLSTAAGSPLTFTPAQLLANDIDPQGRALRVASVGKPSRGTLTPNADGTYTYSPAPGFVGPVTLPYQLQLAGPVLAAPATGHYYEFVSAPGLCWTAARDAAAARTYQGLKGYLATVTSAAEKQALAGRFPGQYWLGAADDAVEGDWRWKTGPEAGQLFWRGGASGTALGYASWSAGQPDDYKNQYRPAGEDYATFYGNSGSWNDLDQCGTGGSIAGYVVEYGGLETCTPVLYATGTVTITVGAAATQSLVLASKASAAHALLKTAKAELAALPNPSSGQFRLRVTAAADGPAQLALYDLQGRRVKAVFAGALRAGEVRELAVEAAELAAGVYLVRLQSGPHVQHLRVAIQK